MRKDVTPLYIYIYLSIEKHYPVVQRFIGYTGWKIKFHIESFRYAQSCPFVSPSKLIYSSFSFLCLRISALFIHILVSFIYIFILLVYVFGLFIYVFSAGVYHRRYPRHGSLKFKFALRLSCRLICTVAEQVSRHVKYNRGHAYANCRKFLIVLPERAMGRSGRR